MPCIKSSAFSSNAPNINNSQDLLNAVNDQLGRQQAPHAGIGADAHAHAQDQHEALGSRILRTYGAWCPTKMRIKLYDQSLRKDEKRRYIWYTPVRPSSVKRLIDARTKGQGQRSLH